jgi:hypothetical protein
MASKLFFMVGAVLYSVAACLWIPSKGIDQVNAKRLEIIRIARSDGQVPNQGGGVSARQTRLYCPLARNFDQHISVQAVREWNHRVFNEDRVLVENQKPEDLPLDLGMEISIPADRTSMAYRRLPKQMVLSLVYAG